MSVKTKRILIAVGMLLVGVLLTVVISNAVGVAEWKLREVNEKNLYQSATFAGKDGVIVDGADGVSIELTEDNEIKIKGTSEVAGEYVIGKLSLQANTAYIFDGSLSNGSNGTMYMTLESGDTVLATYYSSPVVIPASALTSTTEVNIVLHIAKDVRTNVTLRPVICEGSTTADLVDFYE